MNYKEKLRLAKEALDSGSYDKETIEYIFPELKEESEDERIRKHLIKHFGNKSKEDWNGVPVKSILAWLEKQKAIDVLDEEEREFADNVDSYRKEIDAAYQTGYNEGVKATLEKQGEQPKKHDVCDYCDQQGNCVSPCCVKLVEKNVEQKPVQEIEPTPIFKIGDILKRKGKDYTFRVDRIQGGYYQCDRNHGALFPIEEQGNWELVEQKPAWSEEDEENLNWFEKFFRAESVFVEGKDIPQDRYLWFKNLKDRVQPKQEWSEEDEKMLAEIVKDLQVCKSKDISRAAKDAYQNEIDWLKSLRLQNRWKPSKEQMAVLNEVINYAANSELQHWSNFIYTLLKSLREQLKKLK